MRKILFISAMLVISFGLPSCVRKELPDGTPPCIASKIKEIKTGTKTNPPTEVWEWTFNDKKFYYITADCCDQFNNLFDSECNLVCCPDGGIAGSGDGKCPDFKSGKLTKKLIWKDGR